MHTREAPDFWVLHKNMNFAFPLSVVVINNRFNLSIIKRLINLFYLHYSCKKLVQKSNRENLKVIKILCQINQEIMKSSKNNQSSWKARRLMCTKLARICWGRSKSCFLYGFAFQVISEKHCVAKISQGIQERLLYENNCNCNSCYKFDFIFKLSSNYQQIRF